ncbi:hypothetical protein KC340_g16310 [Hortaea werneckii]|nr:hypothetical protein KC342_g16599 [Hortaea werneckii]KAI7080779.1 hypothetical protein KC339_g13488 [Hortaea werneckii]KAI7207304.1 hypothetical protein KC365_g16632 [Hortaea werneckii]KAI7294009.1 hypothetical protein KC340_g16310 [Hortaea werneckii]KAI7379309.1 hypothetical protein KC328_g13423 [Hortaea werneckii]
MSGPTGPANISYVNPAGFPSDELPNEGYRLWLAIVIMIICSGTFVLARIATRLSTHQMGFDDYAIIAAFVSCLIQCTFWAESVRYGYGAAYLLLDEWHRREFNKWWFFGSIFWPLTLTLFKTAIILMNKRIFIQKWFQHLCWCALVVNGCWGLGNILGTIFQCLPIPSMWGQVPAERCFNMTGLWISIVTWDVSTDVFVLGMAIPMVWRLNLKLRDKIMLTGVFMLGALVIIFSILSCSAIADGLERKDSEDNKVTFALANLFQVLESNFGIIGACLPILRVPLKQHLPRIFGSTSPRYGDPSNPPDYYDDSFRDRYVLQKFSHNTSLSSSNGSRRNNTKYGGNTSWRDVSVSSGGPGGEKKFHSHKHHHHHKGSDSAHSPRRSDELGIIHEGALPDGSGGSPLSGLLPGEDGDRGAARVHSTPSSLTSQNAIRKNVMVSVDRADYA